MVDLPSKELLAEITRAATDAGCADVKLAVAYGIEGFCGGEFADINQVDSFYARARLKKPDLWTVADPAADDGLAELKAAAFEQRSPDARAKLLKALGPEDAERVAREWGTTMADYSKPGTPPAGHVAKAKGGPASNPWHSEFKGDRTAAIAAWVTKFGCASASRMAASAGADIAGRPLRRAS